MTNLQKYAQQCEQERLEQAMTNDVLLMPEFEDEDYFDLTVNLMKLQAEVF